ncbi:MAG: hypothetical protein ACKO0W_04685 [Planctomycetota bacterium]
MDPRDFDHVVEGWREAGVAYDGRNLPRNAPDVDLERLLLDTARAMPHVNRLYNTTATWLHDFGDLVAKHRLRRLIRDELSPADHAPLGAVLDCAQERQNPREFASVVVMLSPAATPRALLAGLNSDSRLFALAKSRSGQIGTRWRVYIDDEPLRPKVLRPASWIMKRHPDFVLRADFKCELRASVMASLAVDEGAGESELALARAAGGSRAQVRRALDNLEMTGRVRRYRSKAGTRIELLRFAGA